MHGTTFKAYIDDLRESSAIYITSMFDRGWTGSAFSGAKLKIIRRI